MKSNIFVVPFRRKREGKTYYRKRIKILSSMKCRFVVRKSLCNVQAAVVSFDRKGDRVLLSVNSKSLAKHGWRAGNGNLPSAYLVGLMAGRKALEKGISEAILDIGFSGSTKGSRIYAVVSGAIDSGLKIPVDSKMLPTKDRLEGQHISKYAASLKSNESNYKKQFAEYLTRSLNPEDVAKHFNEIRTRLHG